jgi:hypothetical protein
MICANCGKEHDNVRGECPHCQTSGQLSKRQEEKPDDSGLSGPYPAYVGKYPTFRRLFLGPFHRHMSGVFHRLVDDYLFNYRRVDRDIGLAIRLKALKETAEYVEENMFTVRTYADSLDLIDDCIRAVTLDGLFLEFGVFRGDSINNIARRTKETVHGFDSFEGLPEDWRPGMGKGVFDVEGKLPPVEPNVILHKGWFDQTLPAFCAQVHGDVAFLHVDSDLYTSADTIFTCLRNRIREGTVILFDEYFNIPGWRKHEFRAFQEFISTTGYSYRYLGYVAVGTQVAVRIEAPGKAARQPDNSLAEAREFPSRP